MPVPPDPLQRLVDLETRRLAARRPTDQRPMGNQPGLDGLRAVSVVAVILYHAGFTWMHGGFYGVEVFFVVSGFLITSLLIDERQRDGGVSLRQFWLRRARRLLPALFAMLAAVAAWAWIAGSHEQQSQLRHDMPWALLYVGNWGQIFGKVAYYASVDPPLVRHLWSLAVEEQWYLIWPLAFVGLAALGLSRRATAGILFGLFGAIWLWMWWLTRDGLAPTISLWNPFGDASATDRTNFVYLSTATRAGGLLLGAAAAYVWRPWQRPTTTWSEPGARRRTLLLDGSGAAAVAGLGIAFAVASLAVPYTFQWLLPVVSILSLIAIAVVVHPAALGMRAIFGWQPLVEIGRRSYGLYLWHWPIFVFGHVQGGSAGRFAIAIALTIAVSELCYRFVETPIRRGAIGRWITTLRAGSAAPGRQWRLAGSVGFTSLAAVGVVALGIHYVSVAPFDRAAGGGDESFEITTTTADRSPAGSNTTGPGDTVVGAPGATTDPTVPPTQAPVITAPLPRRVVVVGDSMAHSLAINLPDGIANTFSIGDGSVEGCSVWDTGVGVSSRGFRRTFSSNCAGWSEKWAAAATQSSAQIALVVIGAWDVLDVQMPTGTLVVGTPAHDAAFLANVRIGVAALAATGAKVALLEIACMRPKDVKGAGTPALPERGDDTRVAHLNQLLRQVATEQPDLVTFVPGPTAWCNDPAIANDLGYRWDGVHVYVPGANLIYETIAPQLLSIPIPA